MPEKTPWREPQLWEDTRVKSFREFYDTGIKDAIEHGDWFAGDLGTLQNRVTELIGDSDSRLPPLSNHIHINTQASISQLLFRSPRFVSTPQPQFGPPFGEKLARIEGRILNDWSEETDFFGEFRKTLTDGLLGPMMIFEVGYTGELAVDDEQIEAERAHARLENETILAGGRPRVSKDDYHPVHVEEIERLIAEIEAERQPAPASVLRYAKKHLKFHEDALTKEGARPLETFRHDSIFGERVNILCFACDVTSSTAARRRWVGKWFLRPITEVKANKRYNAEARRETKAADLSALGGEAMKKALKVSGDEEIEQMALLFEGVDLQHGEVIVFSQGATKPLLTAEYHDRRIRPAGPYLTASFAWNPIKDCGVAPPRIYRGHQVMVSFMDTLIATAARRSVPMMAGVGNLLGADEIQKILHGVPAAFINLKKLPPGTTLEQVIQRIPMPEPTRTMFEVRLLHERGSERYSGIGSARSGGGDVSRTATASENVADAVADLSEDRRAISDDLMSRIARDVIRIARKRYTQAKVMDIAGLEAADADGWPLKWSDRDIVRDKGVYVIPGSSRRKDTAVELKLNTELLAIFSKLPVVPPDLLVQLVKRVLDSAGQYNVEMSGLDTAAQMAQIEALLGGAQGQAPAGGPTNPERRAGTSGEGTQAAVQQGAQNVGGGRLPTGAGNGDRPRLMR